ncbi:MAG: AAA family ATPase [Hydrococcus sp. C42_A2020_068]|nr:AAA family ATPase [Hydrococcus sp. C42_A2020_068]
MATQYNRRMRGTFAQLILLIGLPGSGKSFLARQIAARSPKGCIIISTDAIRAQLFGDASIQGSWLSVWREIERQFRDAVEQIYQGKRSKAIYDATNAVRRHRKDAIALARTTGFTRIIGVWLDTPLSLCLERNRRRKRYVPEEIIMHMYRCLQATPPSLEDGLDELFRFTVEN